MCCRLVFASCSAFLPLQHLLTVEKLETRESGGRLVGAQPPARGPRVVFSWLFPCARLYSAGISLYVWPSFRIPPPTSLSVDASFLPSLNVPHARLPQRPDAPPSDRAASFLDHSSASHQDRVHFEHYGFGASRPAAYDLGQVTSFLSLNVHSHRWENWCWNPSLEGSWRG